MTTAERGARPGRDPPRAARVKLAVFDVDGVLTDGRLWYAADGHELKAFHVHDGLGLAPAGQRYPRWPSSPPACRRW